MELKSKCILLASQCYSIPDEKTGEITEGVSIQYIANDNLSPCVDGDLKGARVLKDWIDIKLAQNITVAPAIYEMVFSMAVDTKGKGKIAVKDLKYLTDFGVK